MATARQGHGWGVKVLVVGTMLLVASLGLLVPGAIAQEEGTQATSEDVTTRDVGINTPVFYRQTYPSVAVGTEGAEVSFVRCCTNGNPRAVVDCGFNAAGNRAAMGVTDVYASSDQCCTYRMRNVGPPDRIIPVLVCVRE
jgi:hypothetical protein